jgi:thioesterase domain-containing protein/acyl carrier protein
VRELMEATLGQTGVGANDDFFSLGGTSLLAMDFMARLRKAFGVEVPPSVLFEAPSIRGVATFIEAHLPKPSERADFRFLVPIQRGSPGMHPLFLVAGGWGGEVELLAYAQIGQLLGSDQPIWGLKARGAGTADAPHKSASEMAADYLAEIRALQPVGPYSIAGEWVGGICAHEIACQLRDSGEEVSSLILLDTSVPNEDQLAAYLAEQNREREAEAVNPSFAQRIRHHWEQMGSRTAAGKISYLFKKATGKAIESEPASEQHPRGLAQYPPTLMKHRLRPYPGKVTLLVDEESYALHGQLGWENVPTGDLELHVLPGDQLTYIWEEGAQAAQKLREILSEALQRR